VYGFNGKHLGWFNDATILDHDGNAVGYVKGEISMLTHLEPLLDESMNARVSTRPLCRVRALLKVRSSAVMWRPPFAIEALAGFA
jgi:hypothetical protein